MSTSDPALGLGADLVIASARLVRLVRREHDLPAGARVLSVLDDLGPTSVTDLARADRTAQPTMTGAVNQLLADGLVTKAAHPTDARSSVVALTDAGRTRLAEIRATYAATVLERLRAHGRGTEELAAAVALLQDVLDSVDSLDTPSERNR